MVLFVALALVQSMGQVLVATENSRDPDLARSVVLLIHSDPDGVIGVVLNRPRGESKYFGGPIPMGVRTLAHSGADAQRILPGVYLVPSAKDTGARVYAGYVGWSQRQLIDEISRRLWKIVPGDASIVFDPHPDTLWQRRSR